VSFPLTLNDTVLTTRDSLAYLEMQLTLSTILLRYNIELQSDKLETTEGFMHKPLHMMMKITRRSTQ
jgi:benzoate 4-monooxygenase